MNAAIQYMMLHQDALADEFDAILNLRTILYGVVLGASGAGAGVDNLLLADGSSNLLLADGSSVLLRA